MSEPISMKRELSRKMIHLAAVWIPLTYHFLSRAQMLWIVGLFAALVVAVEVRRFYSSRMRHIFESIFGNVMRAHELTEKKLTGASHTLIASFFVILFFDKPIAIAALLVLVFSDVIAALIGRRFGRIHIAGKTLEGSAAFFFSALAIFAATGYLAFLPMSFFAKGVLAALVATLTELCAGPLRIDDNLVIPLVVGFVLSLPI